MRLYHGSNCGIDVIDLAKSEPFKDFGKGFYLSDNEAQAMDMAIYLQGSRYVYSYLQNELKTGRVG